ncbi:MAG: RNA methyltransferase [Clostridiales bacterium]|nr:RNA methyltransferase [Clostridiales bacterium]
MIISKSNPKIKEVRSLKQKKFRDELGLYFVEGHKMVKEAVSFNLPIKYVVGVKEELDRIDLSSKEVYEVSKEVFLTITDEKNPEGIIAVIEKENKPFIAPTSKCLLLDGISDPGNLGTIIRTATASGFNQIYLLDTVDEYSPKVIRASMSGIYFCTVTRITKEDIDLITLPKISADMNGESVFEFNKKLDKFCLIIGSEAHGVSTYLKEKSDYIVSIPMQSVESLNAGVAAGILMYLL